MIKFMNGKVLDTGYVASQLGRFKLSDARVESWAQFYHKPYALDYDEARHKAYERKADS